MLLTRRLASTRAFNSDSAGPRDIGAVGSVSGAPWYLRIARASVAFSKRNSYDHFFKRISTPHTVQVNSRRASSVGGVDPVIVNRLVGLELCRKSKHLVIKVRCAMYVRQRNNAGQQAFGFH